MNSGMEGTAAQQATLENGISRLESLLDKAREIRGSVQVMSDNLCGLKEAKVATSQVPNAPLLGSSESSISRLHDFMDQAERVLSATQEKIYQCQAKLGCVPPANPQTPDRR